MRGFTGLVLLLTAAAAAQEKPRDSSEPTPRPAAQDLVEKSYTDWDALAGGLEAKLARMLPCDPRVPTAIDEVSSASEVRLAALNQYLKLASAQAKSDADAARAALARQEANVREMESERAESQQELAAVDAQLADLTESAKSRPPLEKARVKLDTILLDMRRRVAAAEQQDNRRAALTVSLRDLVAAYDARREALDAAQLAAVQETVRWSGYYPARLARAQTECSLTNQAPGRPQPKKKQ